MHTLAYLHTHTCACTHTVTHARTHIQHALCVLLTYRRMRLSSNYVITCGQSSTLCLSLRLPCSVAFSDPCRWLCCWWVCVWYGLYEMLWCGWLWVQVCSEVLGLMFYKGGLMFNKESDKSCTVHVGYMIFPLLNVPCIWCIVCVWIRAVQWHCHSNFAP